MVLIPEMIQQFLQKAAEEALPGLKEEIRIEVAQKAQEHDYQTSAAMMLFNKYKKQGSFGYKTCQDMANSIIDKIPKEVLSEGGIASKLSMSKIGNGPDDKSGFFINIFLREDFIQ